MTSVFILSADMDRFEWFHPNDAESRDILVCRKGLLESIPDRPIPIQIGGNEGEVSDFPQLDFSTPCMSKYAWDRLRGLIETDVQLIPVSRADGAVYYAINVLRVVDCFMRDKSRFSIRPLFESTDYGYISAIYEYGLDMSKLGDAAIFKIPEMVGREVYVTDVFKNTVESNGLTGFCFRRIYRTT